MPTTTKSIGESMTPVFAELGRAVYICQAFESSLCFLLSLIEQETAQGEDGAFQAAWDFHSKKTLGQLLKALRERIDVPEELDQYLSEGVDTRNEIVHGYLTRNAEHLYDPKGRLDIEQELAAMKREVKKRDIAANKLIDVYLQKYGSSNEILKRNADRMWEYKNPGSPTDPSSGAH